jgi:hypothetical protein
VILIYNLIFNLECYFWLFNVSFCSIFFLFKSVVLYVRKIRQGLVPPFVNPVGIEWNMSQYIITVNMRQAWGANYFHTQSKHSDDRHWCVKTKQNKFYNSDFWALIYMYMYMYMQIKIVIMYIAYLILYLNLTKVE